MVKTRVSKAVLSRLPIYLAYLKDLPDGRDHISATAISQALKMGEVLVRKDLAMICEGGKPRVGYLVADLLHALETYLGYRDDTPAVLVGTGKLGRALLDYVGFSEYGLRIVAGFDSNYAMEGNTEKGKQIYHIQKLPRICVENEVKIGIITVPQSSAQSVCDMLIDAGIKAIWNFAPVHLRVPQGIVVKNENLAVSLALLSKTFKDLNELN